MYSLSIQLPNEKWVEVECEAFPASRGARDSYGVPLEPDEDAGVVIESVVDFETKEPYTSTEYDGWLADKVLEELNERASYHDEPDYGE